jgi:rubrerythrin
MRLSQPAPPFNTVSKRSGINSMSLAIPLFIAVALIITSLPTWAADALGRPETIAALKELYQNEMTAHRTYAVFAKKAEAEHYVSVARLFMALQTSESIHARNFKSILEKLGSAPEKIPESNIIDSDTKENLKYALDVELSEIDTRYPAYLKRIETEGHEMAITDITHAWKSEKQHRDLILKMQSAIGFFFSKIVRKLSGADTYFVCQRCGSTLTKLPKEICPICGSPGFMYQK